MKAQVNGPSSAAPRLGALRWLLVGATCLSAAAAQAQSPPPRVASKAYTNKPVFRLPFTLSPADRQRAQAVALYACCGDEPLALKETTSPAQTGFKYVATKDGEYGFEITVLDKSSLALPPDLSQQVPSLVVVLDTAAPEIDIAVARLKPSVSGERFFQCLVHDANPDPSSVKLEYQTQEKTWLPLEPVDLGPDQPGVFRLSEAMEKNSTGLLRASARDRAGNFAMREAQIKLAAPERAASTTARNRSDNLVVRSDKLAIPVEPTPPVAPLGRGPDQAPPSLRHADDAGGAFALLAEPDRPDHHRPLRRSRSGIA